MQIMQTIHIKCPSCQAYTFKDFPLSSPDPKPEDAGNYDGALEDAREYIQAVGLPNEWRSRVLDKIDAARGWSPNPASPLSDKKLESQ